jgi:hypothetical protein
MKGKEIFGIAQSSPFSDLFKSHCFGICFFPLIRLGIINENAVNLSWFVSTFSQTFSKFQFAALLWIIVKIYNSAHHEFGENKTATAARKSDCLWQVLISILAIHSALLYELRKLRRIFYCLFRSSCLYILYHKITHDVNYCNVFSDYWIFTKESSFQVLPMSFKMQQKFYTLYLNDTIRFYVSTKGLDRLGSEYKCYLMFLSATYTGHVHISTPMWFK